MGRLKNTSTLLLLATISCLLWGSAFPTLKLANAYLHLNTLTPYHQILFAGYRFFIAGIFTLFFCKFLKIPFSFNKKALPDILRLGAFQITLQYIFFYVGLFYTTGINGSIIVSTGTFFALILSHFYYHNDRLTLNKWFGMIVGFFGVLIANIKTGTTFSFNWLGDGLIMASAFVGALSNILAKEASSKIHPVLACGYQMIFGSVLLIFFGSILAGFNSIPVSGLLVVFLLYLGFLSAAAFSLWYLLLQHHTISKVSIHKFQIPIWGVLLSSILVPGESLKLNSIVALVAVIIGIFSVSRK